MRPLTQLFTGFNVVPSSSDDGKKNIRPYKVKKAVEFLSLPEIRSIDAFNTKVKFLRTRGLNEEEVQEAFGQIERSAGLRVDLHEVSSDVLPGESSSSLAVALPENRTSPFSTVLSFCHKLLMFAGIATSCYYLYRQWLTMKTKLDKAKKDEATTKAELRQIKLTVLRIAGDLEKYQGLQENQTKLLAEINSLKAILTSRQYFEEKKSAKLTMPPWQLVTQSQDAQTSTAPVSTEQSVHDSQSSQTNGHVEVEPKTIPLKSNPQNGTSVEETKLKKVADSPLNSAITNGGSASENESANCGVKESGAKGLEKKKETKKNDKKNNPKN